MSNALHKIERQIVTTGRQAGVARDIHGHRSVQYRKLRSDLARLKQMRWDTACFVASYAGLRVLS